MKLVIVESPAKAKTIEGYLGSGYQVLSSVGHIMDLATSGPGGLGIDVDNDFAPTYKVISGKKKVINQLLKAKKEADEVYIATDLDREGEAIGFHLANQLGLDINDANRIIFSEITKNGILSGLANPRPLNMDLVHSQETRRMIDRIMGFKLSGLLKKKIKAKSAGRVQSVALKMIVEREREIAKFIPTKYYKLVAKTKYLELDYIKNDKQLGKEEVDKLLKTVEGSSLVVSDISIKTKKEQPKAPYITSTFQQDCINQLKISSKRSMQIAQKLYEGIEVNGQAQGLITYMRTDSNRLSQDFINTTKAYIEELYGKEYVGEYIVKKNKGAQDAHEAIRPTNIYNTPEKMKPFLTPQELKVYELIYKRSLMCIMAPASSETKTYTCSANKVDFKYSCSSYPFLGFKKLQTLDLKPDPNWQEQDEVKVKEYSVSEHETQPQPRYSEARLIKELEANGVGRPSTYASIIDILKTRGYVDLVDKKFVPTDNGILVNDQLELFFSDIINVDYTSQLETQLDLIAQHESEELSVLNEFYQDFMKHYNKADQEMEKREAKEVGEDCPECGSPLVERFGRFGAFIACSNYPSCKYIKPGEVKQVATCPNCGGDVVEKRTKRGKIFYGCNNYPKCDYAVWKKEQLPQS